MMDGPNQRNMGERMQKDKTNHCAISSVGDVMSSTSDVVGSTIDGKTIIKTEVEGETKTFEIERLGPGVWAGINSKTNRKKIYRMA